MVAPVAHEVQTLSVGWKEAGVIAVWRTNWTAVGAVGTTIGAIAAIVAAFGAVFAAIFAALAFRREGALLEAANQQVKETQRQVEAMHLPVIALFSPNGEVLGLKNIGSGPAMMVVAFVDGQAGRLITSALGVGEQPVIPKPALETDVTLTFQNAFGTTFKTEATFNKLPNSYLIQFPQEIISVEEHRLLIDRFQSSIKRAGTLSAAATPPPAAPGHP